MRITNTNTHWLEQWFDQAPGFICIMCGPEHNIQVTNEAYRKLVGNRTVIGKSVEQAFPELLDQGLVAILDQVYETGKLYKGKNVQIIVNYPEGPKTLFIDFVCQPLLERGKVVGILAQGHNITEQVEVTAELHDSKRRLDAVLNNASVSIFLMDAKQYCIYMNSAAERLTGFTLAEVQGKPLHDSIHHMHPDGTHYPLEDCPIDRAFPQNNQEQGEEVFVHKDGHFYPVAFTASPIRDDNSTVIGTIIEVRDISQKKAALEALREANQQKDEFLAMLAHELRNPLAPLTNALLLLAKTSSLSEAGQLALRMADRQTKQLKRLVDDLLEVSRFSQGKIALQCAPILIRNAVYNAAQSVSHEVKRRRHRLVIRLPSTPICVLADAARLAQILENLLTNACKYTPDGGVIHLVVEAKQKQVLIHVIDNGIGINPKKIPNLFELFNQVDTTLDRSQGGLGIGLSLVKRLIELHGGKVYAVSDGLGKGAKFTIELPYESINCDLAHH